jgi:hypothetical protein
VKINYDAFPRHDTLNDELYAHFSVEATTLRERACESKRETTSSESIQEPSEWTIDTKCEKNEMKWN